MQTLYDEPFVVAMPRTIPGPKRKRSPADDLKAETMLLLGSGHCFRDQVLEVCPEMARFSSPGNGMQRTFEGSSLETIRHMVASGIGLTVLPRASVRDMEDPNGMLAFVPFSSAGAVAPRGHRLAQELLRGGRRSRRCAMRWRSAICRGWICWRSKKPHRRVGGSFNHNMKPLVKSLSCTNNSCAVLYKQEANHEQAGALLPAGPR
jgi:DNA-binding transcriptional LysR family regulator